jgi:lipopolysaccharide/colanic/teichoic acid biosynthesis glycosyltransferase
MIRFVDFVISLIGLLLLAPFFLLLSIIIILTSKGGAFFIQARVGKDNKDFNLLKFRTMKMNSESKGQITVGKDPRITAIGHFLRNTKLDELPQLINVFKGDMSIVGPRPEVRKYVDLYSSEQRKVLSVRPGISDYASIAFSNESEVLGQQEDPEKYYVEVLIPQKIQMNMKYINEFTLINYFKVILLTLKKIT